MDEENTFVDVCGDGDVENNKENSNGVQIRKSPLKMVNVAAKIETVPSSQSTPSNSAIAIQSKTHQMPSLQPQESIDAENSGGFGDDTDSEEQRAECGPGNGRRAGISRKEKSLGKLCGPFLTRVGAEAAQGRDIHLETVARSMSVEKRRIYDIVNVMEALEVMQKTNKSFYKWHGLGRLPQLMHALQSEAQRGQLPKRMVEVEEAMCKFAHFVTENAANNGNTIVAQESSSTAQQECFDELDPTFGPMASRDRCGKNSLAQLCRRFLMVLLCNPKRKVSLDVVSTMLIKDPESKCFEPPSRSRCRRLYDIANVLVEMRLVKKDHSMFGTKKIPLFVYCGPEPDVDPANAALRMHEFQQRTGLVVNFTMMESGEAASANVDCAGRGLSGEFVRQPKEEADLSGENRKRKRESLPSMTVQPSSSSSSTSASIKVESKELENNHQQPKRQRRILCEQNGQQQEELPRPRPLLPPTALPFQFAACPAPPIFTTFTVPTPTPAFWATPHAQLAIAADRLAQQLIGYSLPQMPAMPVQQGVASGTKMRHSVQSILGVSQRENIAANLGSSNGASPNRKAFRPVQVQQSSEEKPKSKPVPFAQRQIHH